MDQWKKSKIRLIAELELLRAELARPVGARLAETVVSVPDELAAEKENLLNHANDLLCVADSTGRFLWVNPAWERVLGWSSAELLARPFLDLIHPSDLSATIAAVDRIQDGLGTASFETRCRTREGGYRWLQWTVAPQQQERLYAVARDVTERKEVEEALRQERNMLSALLDTAAVLIVVMDREGRVVRFNQACEALTGFLLEEVQGRHFWELLIPPEELEGVEETFAALTAGDFPNRHDNHWLCKDGSRRYLAWSNSALLDEEGRVSLVVACGADMTDRRQFEEELRNAKEAAEAANQAKSEFLATMSHEIRTPMNAIIGMVDLLAESDLDEEQRGFLRVQERAGHNLLELIDDILDLSKVEAGQLELHPVDFDLRELFDTVVGILSGRARAKGLALTAEIAEEIPQRLLGDAKRLRQILLNLIGNAVKFTREGWVHARVELNPAAEGLVPGALLFSVRDTGIGISREQQVTIFDPFAQADPSIHTHYGGTGLGLTIASRLAEMMGGCLWVESEAGKGSTFRFTALFDVVTEAEEPDGNAPLAGLELALIGDGGNTLRTLRRLGARVSLFDEEEVECRDVQRICLERPARTVVVDHPTHQALFQVPQCLRESATGSQVPVVLLASWWRKGDLARARELRVRLVPKPLHDHELIDALTRGVGSSEQERGLSILLAEDSEDNALLIRSYLKKSGHRLDEVRDGRQAVEAVRAHAYDLVLMDVQMPVLDGLAATREIRAWEGGAPRFEATTLVLLHGKRG